MRAENDKYKYTLVARAFFASESLKHVIIYRF